MLDLLRCRVRKLLEEVDAAPQLLYYGKVGVNEGDPTYGHLKMVVMEYLDGMTASQARGSIRFRRHSWRVRGILKRLHDNEFVFGDLCSAKS
jgi:hypothetical protein